MTIIVAGAGIGGLVTALSLDQIGADVIVLEAAHSIEPLGVGINVLPHAMRELFELDLQSVIVSTGVATSRLAYYSKRGQPIWEEPRGIAAGYHWPQISIHRGTLQHLLLQAVTERLGAERVLAGQRVAGWQEDADGVTVICQARHGEPQSRYRGSLLIGADGIHSAVRAQLYPDEGPPIWNGAVLWRGITRGASFLDGRTMIMAGHERQKFVCYPIRAADRGGSVINWIAELKFPPTHTYRREDWNRPGRLEDFLPAFESWRFAWLDIPELIRAGERPYEYPMVDRDPLPRWRHGRVTLLGDAAHAMYPIGSNGASQAILDARVLARSVRDHGASIAALESYEAERRPATTAIVLANRRNGPEQVMQMVEERAPKGFARVSDVLAPEELQGVADAYKRIAGFSIDELNARPPILGLRHR
jgi:2-polyprenyl-6-methoxyphenol hydroxylase-like FAD-dependent oxidoreductase